MAVVLASAVAFSGLSGCAFSDGNPWGVVEIDAYVSFDTTDRINAQGQLRTSNDYLVALDTFEIAILDVAVLATGSAATGSSTFDPSDPPAGYSLCHNGHCHHDDGRLVDYADIEAELAAGSGVAATERISSRVGVGVQDSPIVAVSTGDEPVQLILASCSANAEVRNDDGNCELDFGAIVGAEATITSLHVTGTVFDRRTGEAARLPDTGRSFDITLSAPLTASTTLDLPVDKDSPATYRLGFDLGLPASLFDSIDWPTLPETPIDDLDDDPTMPSIALALATLAESLLADTRLTITVE